MKKEVIKSIWIFIPTATLMTIIFYRSDVNLLNSMFSGIAGALCVFFVPFLFKKKALLKRDKTDLEKRN